MANCKICGKEYNVRELTKGRSFGFVVMANCECGVIRSRERVKGCPNCGEKASHEQPIINITKIDWRGRYHFKCDVCGHTWKVKP